MSPENDLKLAIAGNPNSGKTTIFNALTGARQHVGNWPGVTVERKEGRYTDGDLLFTAIDLPGSYSLSTYSLEEEIAQSYLTDEDPDIVINVVDASNLERNLYLTTQLIELGQPLVIVLNMMDMAREKGVTIDSETLGTLLGAPVVKVVGRTGEGIDELRTRIRRVVEERSSKARRINVPYSRDLDGIIAEFLPKVVEAGISAERARWHLVKLLENPDSSKAQLNDEVMADLKQRIDQLEGRQGDSIRSLITQSRYGFIAGAMRECVSQTRDRGQDHSRQIDRVLTNRWLGLPLFGFAMWLMFKATYELGAYPMDWIDAGVAAIINGLSSILPDSMMTSLVVDGAIGGVGAIAVFLPNIFILFFIIALLEDSGYMARVAFIMDRIMHNIGLHGKAFIPMVMGFGCNVPAIMGTRILESRRDRLLTVLINPFMSCSARLPVYVLVAGAFFPERAALIIFSMYLTGILVAILTGKLFSKTIVKGMSKPFVLELPPYQRPTLRSLAMHTWERGVIFIRKMGTVILVGSIIVWALGYFPRNVELERDYSAERNRIELQTQNIESELTIRLGESVAQAREQYSSTLVPFEESRTYQELNEQFTTLQTDNLQAAAAARADIEAAEIAETTSKKLIGRLGQLFQPIVAPLGFSWRESVALITGFVAKEIVVSTYGVLFGVGSDASEDHPGIIASLRNSGMTPLVALAFLVFTLLYTPCLATVAAIKRETASWGYTLFSVGYSLGLAYFLAFLIVKIGGAFNWLS